MATPEPAPASARRTRRTAAAAVDRALPPAVMGAIRAARDKKASDLTVLDLRKAGGFTDYFLICTGQNPRQIAAIADSVTRSLKEQHDERPALTEGMDKSEWVLLDYFNFVVHVFSPECRAFYGLERLWGDAERIEVPDPAPAS
jgi:ribosome-associated protein